MINGGIFGPKLSGKTTLAKALSKEYYAKKGIRSLVFDPHLDRDWGNQAWLTNNPDQFWAAVWKAQGCLVIAEEAAVTIDRDGDLVPVFTMLRHNRHRLLIVGHSGRELTLGMRNNMDTLYLFKQGPAIAKIWTETIADKRIMECTTLDQYEFLLIRPYKIPERRKLSI